MQWQIEKQKNGNYKIIPSDNNEDRSFFLDAASLEPITYWFCSYNELLEIVQEIKNLQLTQQEV